MLRRRGTGLRKAHFTLRLIWKRDLDEIIGVVACSHRFLDQSRLGSGGNSWHRPRAMPSTSRVYSSTIELGRGRQSKSPFLTMVVLMAVMT